MIKRIICRLVGHSFRAKNPDGMSVEEIVEMILKDEHIYCERCNSSIEDLFDRNDKSDFVRELKERRRKKA